MEGQPNKRRRVYSLEPNKIVQSMFASKYVNYLVPALRKIKEKSTTSEEDKSRCDLKTAVKYEVDNAMVFSAQGFAWSNALKVELQRGTNADRSTASIVETEANEGSSRPSYQNEMVPQNLSENPSSIFESKKLVRCSKVFPVETKENIDTGENEKEDISSRLGKLRRLLPGGEEMCDEEIIGELESYISCLQMQVNILQCLADQIHIN